MIDIENIEKLYKLGMITDNQLQEFVNRNYLTKKQYEEILKSKS